MRLRLSFLLAAASALACAHAAEDANKLVALHADQPVGLALEALPRFHGQHTRSGHLIDPHWEDALAGDAGELIVQRHRDENLIRWEQYEFKARNQLEVTPVPANIPEPPVVFMVLGGAALVSFARRKI